ncbi:MAG: molecular chaperone DjlA [Bacteroidetes bacterium GWF2_33_16]|nr:MAG: molecular chaperone DjlA [Bacteroidetes bacterium GWE2_32_14]OFY05890.1 MAG: molecular chaperone DjlA [Bacteroidetes bacterium GWF2_33_16]
MGKFAKWVAGGLGWAFFGPIGGIVGFTLGSLLDTQEFSKTTSYSATTSGSFAISLLVLVAAVMKADGKILRSELDYVKKYFIQTFGEESAIEALKMLRDILKQDIPLQAVSLQIKDNLDYPSRLQLLHFLMGVSNADGQIAPSELNTIATISSYMGVTAKDFESIKSMFIDDTDSAYKILEINKSATDDEVKKAYRKMAIKYHPDKVNHLGEDFQNAAKEKFQKVNQAYEKIKKERNMV